MSDGKRHRRGKPDRKFHCGSLLGEIGRGIKQALDGETVARRMKISLTSYTNVQAVCAHTWRGCWLQVGNIQLLDGKPRQSSNDIND
jgi:hypothetical protein